MTTQAPKLLFAADIARYLGWTTERARRWLISTGAGSKRGGRYCTTPGKLAAHFPEVFDAVLEREE
jgi:hypothetical protein